MSPLIPIPKPDSINLNHLHSYKNVPRRYYPTHPNKDVISRLNRFVEFIGSNDQGVTWTNPDLACYRDHLMQSLDPRSAQAHLSTIRQALLRVARDREYLYLLAGQFSPPDTPPLALKALVDEIAIRLMNAAHPDESKISLVKKQDTADSDMIRLTSKQAAALLDLPDRMTLAGLRDAAIIGMALATGLRAEELVSLMMDDLEQKMGGQPAVRVREGKGGKQRLVPYGAEIGVLQLVQRWLTTAGIAAGAVFRGVNNRGQIQDYAITTRTFERRLALYPVDGLTIKPHDLRRTYALRRHLDGMDIIALRDNLGHADIKTTQTYIGKLDVSMRVPMTGLDYNGRDDAQ